VLSLKTSEHVLGIKDHLFGGVFSFHIGFIHMSEYSDIDCQASLVTKLNLIESSWRSFSNQEKDD